MEVLLLHVYSALGVELLHVGFELVDQYQLRRRSHADAEGDLALSDRKYLALLHSSDGILVDELARERGQVEPLADGGLPVGLHIAIDDGSGPHWGGPRTRCSIGQTSFRSD